MGWSKLKAIFAEKDVWTILRALVSRGSRSACSWAGRPGDPAVWVFFLRLLGLQWYGDEMPTDHPLCAQHLHVTPAPPRSQCFLSELGNQAHKWVIAEQSSQG